MLTDCFLCTIISTRTHAQVVFRFSMFALTQITLIVFILRIEFREVSIYFFQHFAAKTGFEIFAAFFSYQIYRLYEKQKKAVIA